MVVEVIGFGCILKVELTLLRKIYFPCGQRLPEIPRHVFPSSALKWGFGNKNEKHWPATLSLSSAAPQRSLLLPGSTFLLSVLHQILLCAQGQPSAQTNPPPFAHSLPPLLTKQDSSHPPRLNFATPSPTLGTPSLLMGDTNSTLLHMCSPCSLKAL